MNITRRLFAKANAAVVAAAAIGLPLPAIASNLITNRELTSLKWNKAPCRFCGTGCGVRSMCSNCHVPHDWTYKIARKMQASKEVWGKIFGTINTRDKFLTKRRELAEREWARLKANDSLECRNCHALASMDFTLQSPRAQTMHSTLLASGEKTCIDCHKGIAHHLPDMAGVPMVTQNWHDQMMKEKLLEP